MALFLRGKVIYGYNESVRSDGVIVAWKADNPLAFYTHFQVLQCPSWFERDKDFFSESYGIH